MLTPDQFKAAMDKFIEKITPSKDRPQLTEEQHKLVKDALGYPGRMISGSKQTPRSKNGEHLAVFNGNVCVGRFGKVWYGDIDITRDEQALIKLSKDLGYVLHILREHDARFENENNPQYQKAVYSTNGIEGNIGNAIDAAYYGRNEEDGKLYRKPRGK